MKRFTIGFLFVIMMLGVAPLAQAARKPPQILEIVGLSLLNKAIAGGQHKEFSAGAIYPNVFFHEKDGKLKPLQGWNTAAAVESNWSDDFVLQPVLFINSSRSPREVQWTLQDSRGIRKIQFNPMSGGRRGKNGEAVDNRGYKYEPPMVDMRDVAYGWFAISGSWGDGQSATIVGQHINVRDIVALMDREDIKAAWAGNGTALAPATPVFLVRMPNGDIRPFMSQQELELELAKQNAGPSKRQDPPPADPSKTVEVAESTSFFEVRSVLYDLAGTRQGNPDEIRMNLAKAASGQGLEASDALTIPKGNGRAMLVTADHEFTAELVSPEGKVLKSYQTKSFEFEGKTSFATLVLLSNDGQMTSQLTLRSGSERRVITFTKEELR